MPGGFTCYGLMDLLEQLEMLLCSWFAAVPAHP